MPDDSTATSACGQIYLPRRRMSRRASNVAGPDVGCIAANGVEGVAAQHHGNVVGVLVRRGQRHGRSAPRGSCGVSGFGSFVTLPHGPGPVSQTAPGGSRSVMSARGRANGGSGPAKPERRGAAGNGKMTDSEPMATATSGPTTAARSTTPAARRAEPPRAKPTPSPRRPDSTNASASDKVGRAF